MDESQNNYVIYIKFYKMQTNYRVRNQTSGFLQNEGGVGEERQDGEIF